MRHLPAISFCGIVALQLQLSPAALGQAATTPTKGESTPLNLPDSSLAGDSSGGSGGLVRTIVGLAIVIGVIYGVTWVLKQVQSSKDDGAAGRGLATNASLPLGGGRSVQLVRAGEEYLLLGVADGGVTTLRTYTEREAHEAGFVTHEDAFDDSAPRGGGAPGNFLGQLLQRLRDLTVRR